MWVWLRGERRSECIGVVWRWGCVCVLDYEWERESVCVCVGMCVCVCVNALPTTDETQLV